VQELIERIRNDGVQSGREQAQQLLDAARQQAESILADARQQAGQIIENARQAAETHAGAGRNAIELAWRDAMLTLKEKIAGEFVGRLRNLVRERIDSEPLVADLLRMALERVTPPPGAPRPCAAEVPATWVEARRDDGELPQLDSAVRALCCDLMEQGLQLEGRGGAGAGFRIRFEQGELVLDLTDQALTDYLAGFLLPRLREYLDGIIH
jgi:V/A-type H+-transporting ATPase subunit E